MSEESYKSFKDPVYGYIDIPSTWASAIVDTPVFQRLRCIAQTSYAPLYPSATHNRFVHSLGVYHLGSIVKREVENCSIPDLLRKKRADVPKLVCERYLQIFLLACLLHDVGHAPFSHTGEDFYIEKSENGQSKALKEEVGRAKRKCEQTRNKADRILDRASIWAQKELFQKLVVALRSFANDASIPFSFQLLNGKTFTSGFAKSDLSKLQIELGIKGQTIDFGKITKTLDSRDGTLPQTVYYLFCKKINGDKAKLSCKLVEKLKGFVKDNRQSIEKVFG